MSKAKMLGQNRKALPNNRCYDKHWKGRKKQELAKGKKWPANKDQS